MPIENTEEEVLTFITDRYGEKEYVSESLTSTLTEENFILTGATFNPDTKSLSISPGGSASFTLTEETSGQFASQALLLHIEHNQDTQSDFALQGLAKLSISYHGDPSIQNHYLFYDRDPLPGATHANLEEYIINTKAKHVNQVTVTIFNSRSTNLYIPSFAVYRSQDINALQIAGVFKESVVVADVVQATANFSAAQFSQYIRTNVFSLQALEGLIPTEPFSVHFLQARDDELVFYSTEHSNEEKEHFTIRVGNEDIQFFYAIIGDHPDAYKYITTVDPRSKYPNMNDLEYDKFKFYIWKETSRSDRGSWRYEEVLNSNGQVIRVPVITLGQGYTNDPSDHRGRAKLIKDNTGYSQNFYLANGDYRGIRMDESGARFHNCDEILEQVRLHPSRFIVPETTDPESEPLHSFFVMY